MLYRFILAAIPGMSLCAFDTSVTIEEERSNALNKINQSIESTRRTFLDQALEAKKLAGKDITTWPILVGLSVPFGTAFTITS